MNFLKKFCALCAQKNKARKMLFIDLSLSTFVTRTRNTIALRGVATHPLLNK